VQGRHYSEIQRDQASEGARMANAESGVEPIVYRSAKRRVDVASSKPPRSKDKVKPKGHEAFLKQIEASGTDVTLEKISSGEMIKGKVKCSDKYTVTIKQTLDDGATRDRVIFKHDISEFSALAGRPDEVTSEANE
jgi:sRNA-binding regulator protein Hfq